MYRASYERLRVLRYNLLDMSVVHVAYGLKTLDIPVVVGNMHDT